jgi:hypothetical protein
MIVSGISTILSIFKTRSKLLTIIDSRNDLSLNNLISITPERYSMNNGHWELCGNDMSEIFYVDDQKLESAVKNWLIA